MSVDFRNRSCPLCSVWEESTLKLSLDEKDEDYFMAGVVNDKDHTPCLPGGFIESLQHRATLF